MTEARRKCIEGAVDFEMSLIKSLINTGSELTGEQLIIIHDHCIGLFASGYKMGLEIVKKG